MNDRDFTTIVGIPYILSEDGTYWEIDKNSNEYKRYKEGSIQQLKDWLDGIPTINKWHSNSQYWEDTPDFSSSGSRLWDFSLRLKFYNADDETRSKMCMMSLSELISNTTEININTYISSSHITKH